MKDKQERRTSFIVTKHYRSPLPFTTTIMHSPLNPPHPQLSVLACGCPRVWCVPLVLSHADRRRDERCASGISERRSAVSWCERKHTGRLSISSKKIRRRKTIIFTFFAFTCPTNDDMRVWLGSDAVTVLLRILLILSIFPTRMVSYPCL